jgi:uncharacterized membrane protein
MTKTVVALYDDIQQAHDAVRDLTSTGISRENISLVTSDAEESYAQQLNRDAETNIESSSTAENVGKGAGAGAVLGGLGGLVVGLGALAIPGIGPVVAAGPIAAALAGAGIGAAAGGLVGALVDLGIPEEEAKLYSEGIRHGGSLVSVQAEDRYVDRVIDILNNHHPVDLNERRSQWSTQENEIVQPVDRMTGSRPDKDWSGTERREEPSRDDFAEQDVLMHSEHLESTGMEDQRDFEQQWRSHFQQTNRQGVFDDYMPAYRYGYRLNERENFYNRQWMDIESEVRMDWEQRNPDYPFNDYREYIRYGWESRRGLL